MSAELLALLESDPAAGILRVAEEVEAEASRLPYGYGKLFDVDDPEQAAWISDFLLAVARGWRGVVERHGDPDHYCVGRRRSGHWKQTDQYRDWIPEPCSDVAETADEARAYAGGAS